MAIEDFFSRILRGGDDTVGGVPTGGDPTGTLLARTVDPTGKMDELYRASRRREFFDALGPALIQSGAPSRLPVTWASAIGNIATAGSGAQRALIDDMFKSSQTNRQLSGAELERTQSADLKDKMQSFQDEIAEAQKERERLLKGGAVRGVSGSSVPESSGSSTPSSGGVIATPIPDESISPHIRALIDTIAYPESGGIYNIRYAGPNKTALFGVQPDGSIDYSQHPQVYAPTDRADGKKSSAAGYVQFVHSTWEPNAREAGVTDFSPASQIKVADHLMRKTYLQQTGRDLNADLQAGKLTEVADALKGHWPMFPSAIKNYQGNLQKYMKAQPPVGGQPTTGGPAVSAAPPGSTSAAPPYDRVRARNPAAFAPQPVGPQGAAAGPPGVLPAALAAAGGAGPSQPPPDIMAGGPGVLPRAVSGSTLPAPAFDPSAGGDTYNPPIPPPGSAGIPVGAQVAQAQTQPVIRQPLPAPPPPGPPTFAAPNSVYVPPGAPTPLDEVEAKIRILRAQRRGVQPNENDQLILKFHQQNRLNQAQQGGAAIAGGFKSRNRALGAPEYVLMDFPNLFGPGQGLKQIPIDKIIAGDPLAATNAARAYGGLPPLSPTEGQKLPPSPAKPGAPQTTAPESEQPQPGAPYKRPEVKVPPPPPEYTGPMTMAGTEYESPGGAARRTLAEAQMTNAEVEGKKAGDARMQLGSLGQAIKGTTTGPGQETILDWQKKFVTYLPSFSGKDLEFDTALKEIVLKEGTLAGMANAHGADPTPSQLTIQAAIKANPNLATSKVGARFLIALLQETQNRIEDRAKFFHKYQYNDQNPRRTPVGAQEAFEELYPAEAYVSRVLPYDADKTPSHEHRPGMILQKNDKNGKAIIDPKTNKPIRFIVPGGIN